jgi:hypothetical protein
MLRRLQASVVLALCAVVARAAGQDPLDDPQTEDRPAPPADADASATEKPADEEPAPKDEPATDPGAEALPSTA